MLMVDAKRYLFDNEILELLKLSMFNPTQERVLERAERYSSGENFIANSVSPLMFVDK